MTPSADAAIQRWQAAKKNHGFLEMTPEGVKKLADRVHEWIEVLTAEVTETTRPAERTARPTDTESELHLAALDYSIAVRQQSGYAITIAEQKLKEAARRMSQ